MENWEMKKTLSLWNFFTIGFGAMIGTGWILLVGDWIVLGGGPIAAMTAYLICALFLIPICMVFGELGAAIPVAGGIIEYVDRTYGRKLSYVTGWFLVLGNGILPAWSAIAVSTLISKMFGNIFPIIRSVKLYTILGDDVYLIPTLVSLIFVTYVVRLNFLGARSAARLQGFLTKMLLTGMVIAMIISFVKGGPENLKPAFSVVQEGAVKTGGGTMLAGIAAVLVMAPFFYTGFDTVPQQVEEAKEGIAWKHFGTVIVLALLATAFFYIVCIYSFGTILPWTEFIKRPVPALACLNDINGILYILMLTIATLGPLGPMNSFYSASARIILAMGRKRMLPEIFGRLDPVRRTPKGANILLAVFTFVAPFFGSNLLVPLTNVSSFSFIFACTTVSLACFKMRKTEPDLYRPYKVLGGRAGIFSGILAGIIIMGLMIVPESPAALSTVEWLIVLSWLVLGTLFYVINSKKVRTDI